MRRAKKKGFEPSRASPKQRMRSNTSLIHNSEYRLIFILGTFPMMEGGRRERRDGWRAGKVEAWSALVVPGTDGQDERGTQAQLRPCSVPHYKTRTP